MTIERFEEIKQCHLSAMQEIMKEMGQILPQLNIFGYYKEEPTKKTNLIFGVHPSFLQSDEAKDDFVEHVLPSIAKNIKDRGFVMEAVAWSTEGWQRTFRGKKIPKNYRDLPAIEVLMINFQSAEYKELCTFEIKRTGKQVNGLGELVDFIELEKGHSSKTVSEEGRFGSIFKKLSK